GRYAKDWSGLGAKTVELGSTARDHFNERRLAGFEEAAVGIADVVANCFADVSGILSAERFDEARVGLTGAKLMQATGMEEADKCEQRRGPLIQSLQHHGAIGAFPNQVMEAHLSAGDGLDILLFGAKGNLASDFRQLREHLVVHARSGFDESKF